MNWTPPDVEGLVEFLVRDKGFKYVSARIVRLAFQHADIAVMDRQRGPCPQRCREDGEDGVCETAGSIGRVFRQGSSKVTNQAAERE